MSRSHIRLVCVLLIVLAVACEPPPDDPGQVKTPDSGATVTLLPIPDGPMGVSIRRGLAILNATRDSLPDHVGNDLRCTSCHLYDGTRPHALPWTGVYGRFPQYRSRSARVARLEDRINDCLLRSLNGKALGYDDDRMRDMVAYMAHLSSGQVVGDSFPGQGVPRPQQLAGDSVHGAAVWQAECTRCHGDAGQGTVLAPPVWGPRSFNIGAGMARFQTVAGFVRQNMPLDRPGSLSEKDALDVAAYITARSRPDFPGKENDWPKGSAPPDVAYKVNSAGGQ